MKFAPIKNKLAGIVEDIENFNLQVTETEAVTEEDTDAVDYEAVLDEVVFNNNETTVSIDKMREEIQKALKNKNFSYGTEENKINRGDFLTFDTDLSTVALNAGIK